SATYKSSSLCRIAVKVRTAIVSPPAVFVPDPASGNQVGDDKAVPADPVVIPRDCCEQSGHLIASHLPNFQSQTAIFAATPGGKHRFWLACFNQDYPITDFALPLL